MLILPKNQSVAPSCDQKIAAKFIEALGLDPQMVVFQKFPGKTGGYAQIQIGSLEPHWEWVEASNTEQNCSISIMTNPARGAKQTDITLVQTVFADDDTLREAYRTDWSIAPHIITETSPGKYHYFWRTNQGALAWKELGILQGKIAKAYGTDESLSDPAKKARLPGTLHLKGSPFLTHIVKVRSHSPFSRKELIEAFGSFELEATPKAAPCDIARGAVDAIPEGGRNAYLHKKGSAYRGLGLGFAEIEAILQKENNEKCKLPLAENEVYAIASSAARYEPNAVRFALTDAGNSERFSASVGGKFCYDFKMKKYLTFDGRVWKPDHAGQVSLETVAVVRSILAEASQVEDDKARSSMLVWAKKSESIKAIQALLEGAKPLLAVDSSLFDVDGWSLNCLNGYLDLNSGKLLLHAPDQLCLKMADVVFDPTAKAPKRLKFIQDFTFLDNELADYLQTFVGRSLTGDVSTQSLTLLFGLGVNGKGVFTSIVEKLLGGYVAIIRPDFLLNNAKDVELETLELRGARLAICHELPENGKLAEGRVKCLTGGDSEK
ncbi:MAG: phage/plasmid primase, P4 family [Methyloglobulus sp.]